MTLLEQIERALASRRLIAKGESLVVAVSGGVDSMVLLDLLQTLAPHCGLTLTVAHLNHQLRGRSSQADEALVRKTARRLKLRCVVARADIKGLARRKKQSIEMAAREARHRFLAATAKRVGAAKVVLAHQADDQIELFFLRLFRGSGSDGLAGMKWRNPSPADPKIEVIRPLLEVTKAALVEYAREHRVTFREDATNAHVGIPRNRIRHELLPLLRSQFQPQLDRLLSRTREILGAESDFMLQAARDWLWAKTREPFIGLPVAMQRRVLQLQLLDHGIVPDFDQLEVLRLNPETVVEFSGGLSQAGAPSRKKPVRLSVDRGGRLGIAPSADGKFSKSSIEIFLAGPNSEGGDLSLLKSAAKGGWEPAGGICGNDGPNAGKVEFEGLAVSWGICRRAAKAIPKPLAGREIFDADQVGSQVILRHWQPGDRFQPIGMKTSSKLQDYFVNAKVPRAERHRRVVAVNASGTVFWVEGMRISERFKLTANTTRSLHWVWKRL